MKKILTASFLTLGIILISGCSLIEQKPVDNSAMTEQITVLQQQMSGFSSEMETLKQENEQSENKKFSDFDIEYTYDEFGNILYSIQTVRKHDKGYIGVEIGGNDGIQSKLLYLENGKIIEELESIFWYDYDETSNIYEICNDILPNCKIAKKTQCKNNNSYNNKECINIFHKYMYNLINSIEHNDYFLEKFNLFIKGL